MYSTIHTWQHFITILSKSYKTVQHITNTHKHFSTVYKSLQHYTHLPRLFKLNKHICNTQLYNNKHFTTLNKTLFTTLHTFTRLHTHYKRFHTLFSKCTTLLHNSTALHTTLLNITKLNKMQHTTQLYNTSQNLSKFCEVL